MKTGSNIPTLNRNFLHPISAVATKDIVIVQDADLEYDPIIDYPRVMKPIIDDEADVVYGSRFIKSRHVKGHIVNYIGNKVFTSFSNRMTGLKLTDVET